jgi:hypothetical protein
MGLISPKDKSYLYTAVWKHYGKQYAIKYLIKRKLPATVSNRNTRIFCTHSYQQDNIYENILVTKSVYPSHTNNPPKLMCGIMKFVQLGTSYRYVLPRCMSSGVSGLGQAHFPGPFNSFSTAFLIKKHQK